MNQNRDSKKIDKGALINTNVNNYLNSCYACTAKKGFVSVEKTFKYFKEFTVKQVRCKQVLRVRLSR